MRYLLYPFALIVVLTFAITGALLIGRAQPLPDRVAVLHLNDMCKLPCWIGITPGVTTLGEAEKLVQRVYKTSEKFKSTETDASEYVPINAKSGTFNIVFDLTNKSDAPNQVVVSTIILALYEGNLTMGDVYPVIGAPQQIIFDGAFGEDLTLYYHALKVISFLGYDLMSASVENFTIADWSPADVPDFAVGWHGFRDKPSLFR